MESRIEEVRRLLDEFKQGRTNLRMGYPDELRQLAITYVKDRLAAGGTFNGAADALGISTTALREWMRESGEWRPVKVASFPSRAASSRSEIVLVTATGLRIEGLDLKSVIAVAQALS